MDMPSIALLSAQACLLNGTHSHAKSVTFMTSANHSPLNMSEPVLIETGAGAARAAIAVRKRPATKPGAGPGLLWLGGFHSDMKGTKAQALDEWAAEQGRACTRFDYFGHGESGGRFEDGTITRWLDDSLIVFDAFCDGPHILIGSSMGGWIALLLARALRLRGDTGRLAGMALVAPAPDFTQDLMWNQFSPEIRAEIETKGFWRRPSEYDGDGYIVTRALIEDGRKHLLLDAPIETGCPVRILQGAQDADVPWQHAFRLTAQLPTENVVLTLVQDGDHRLSRPQDIARMLAMVAEF